MMLISGTDYSIIDYYAKYSEIIKSLASEAKHSSETMSPILFWEKSTNGTLSVSSDSMSKVTSQGKQSVLLVLSLCLTCCH